MKKLLITFCIFALSFNTKAQTPSREFKLPTITFDIHDHYAQHYYAGVLISGFVGYTHHYFSKDRTVKSAFIGLGVTGAVAFGKEYIYDGLMHRGVTNPVSALFTMFGGVVSAMINVALFNHESKKNLYPKYLYEDIGNNLKVKESIENTKYTIIPVDTTKTTIKVTTIMVDGIEQVISY